MSTVVAALRFGFWGALAMGAIYFVGVAYNKFNSKEEPHGHGSNRAGRQRKKEKMDPFILNVATRCEVCKEDIKDDEVNHEDRRMILPACGHQYHKRCVDGLKNAGFSTCPLCRKPF